MLAEGSGMTGSDVVHPNSTQLEARINGHFVSDKSKQTWPSDQSSFGSSSKGTFS